MARFLVHVPHAPEDCVKALDSVLGHSDALLSRFDWGCKDDEHVGWTVMEALDGATALMMLPSHIRDEARATRLTKFTVEEVKAFHLQ